MRESIFVWSLIGFLAQLINGTLGMGYGVSSTTALITIGIYPALASASVHTAEVFTTLASGFSHLKFGNVDRNIALHLIIPGIIGGVFGAYLLTHGLSGRSLNILVGFILLSMGFIIMYRFTFKNTLPSWIKQSSPKFFILLGFFGAFIDAIGGGGWGPILTTTLVVNNVKTNKAIGTVNFSKFFIVIAETITFLLFIGIENFNWLLVMSLTVGGVFGAPIAAWLCRKLPYKILGILAGITIIILSIRILISHTS